MGAALQHPRDGGRIRISQANPARGVKFPQKASEGEADDDRWGASAKLLKQLDEPHRTMVSLIAATGLRVGELLALRWWALDLRSARWRCASRSYEGKFQAPKTQRAVRTIPLGPHAVKALMAHRDAWRRGAGRLVFGNRKGGPLRESKLLRNVLQPAAVAVG